MGTFEKSGDLCYMERGKGSGKKDARQGVKKSKKYANKKRDKFKRGMGK